MLGLGELVVSLKALTLGDGWYRPIPELVTPKVMATGGGTWWPMPGLGVLSVGLKVFISKFFSWFNFKPAVDGTTSLLKGKKNHKSGEKGNIEHLSIKFPLHVLMRSI